MTAHSTAFKFHFTIMSKFYRSSQKLAFFPNSNYPSSLSRNRFQHRSTTDLNRHSPLLSDRDCSRKTTLARIGAALLFNANYYLVRVRCVAFPRKPLERQPRSTNPPTPERKGALGTRLLKRVSVTCEAREKWSHVNFLIN